MSGDMSTAFFQAVKSGDERKVTQFLDEERDLVDAFDPKEFDATPLNLAASRGNVSMIDILLARGADINRKSNWWAGGFAPIHSIFWTHHESLGPALIERGATVDAHAAAGLGMVDRLQKLLDERPERIRERGGDGQHPLHFAATPDVAALLLERGADIDARDVDHESTPAQWAARSRPAVTRYLVDRGAEVDPFLLSAIGDTGRLERFLDEQPDAGAWVIDGQRFPITGSEAEHIYCYTLGWQGTPLHVAARCNRPESIRVLIARGVDPGLRGDYDDCTPLHIAAWEGSVEAIDALVDGGAPIDAASGKEHQNEPLGWAVVAGRDGSVEALLARGAQIHAHHREQAATGVKGAFQQWSPQPISSWERIASILGS